MTKKILVIAAPGFEEIETISVVDILRRSGARFHKKDAECQLGLWLLGLVSLYY